jgi:hypothetical protein
VFNYPAFWRLFFYSGITQADAIWAGAGMITLFFGSLLLLSRDLTATGALGMLLVLFSPASMLLYERGNVDLIVFALCVVIVLASQHAARTTAVLLMAGIVMKLYPFFGVTVLLRESKARFVRLLAGCVGLMLLYVVLTWDSISAAWTLTERGDQISYGANVFFFRHAPLVTTLLGRWFTDPAVDRILQLGPILLAAVLMLAGGGLGLRVSDPGARSERHLAAFRMGASVYLGTFLLGNNWDYRLTFLVLAIPQLVEWTRSTRGRFRYAVVGVLIAAVASCWHLMVWFSPFLNFSERSTEAWFAIDELLNWMLVPGFASLLGATSPAWAKEAASGSRSGRGRHLFRTSAA